MKKVFWTLFCLFELTLPVLGGNLPGGTTPGNPAQPTVADGPQVSINVTAGICNPTTNQYTLTGTISLVNSVAGSLTITDGSTNTTINVTAGQTSASFSLAGLQAGSGMHTVTVSGGNYTATPATGTFAIVGANKISCTALSPTQRQIKFTPQYTGLNGSPVTFAVVGHMLPTTTAGPYTLDIYNDNPAITLNAQQGNVQSTFRYNWLDACNNNSSGYSASTTYTAPTSCASTTAQFSLDKQVDKSRATIGEILTYTLTLTNKSSNTLNNVTVRDSMSTGLTYQANSATPPAGTVFSKGPSTTSTWTVNSLAAGQTLSLTLRAKVDSSGVLYSIATLPGVIAKACTSIPIKVCTGDTYVFRLILDPGRSNYKWFRNDVEIAGQTTNILDVSAPGVYRMSSDNNAGSCTEYSCCPFIIEEDAVPSFQASAQPATCSGDTPQNNARITLTGFNTAHSFQYSSGTSFNPTASLSGAAQPIPANGVLASNLANPGSTQSYTIRVYNGADCYTDATVQLQPANCSPSGARLALAVTPGSCASATNQYTLTGTISLTNAVAGLLTITDGSVNTTLNVSAGQTSASFSLAGLPAGSGSRSVSVSGAGYTSASATYTAPVSCSSTTPTTPITPILALSVTPGSCATATNQYDLTGTISLTNAVASSLTITDGTANTTLSVSAGQTSASFSLTGLPSGSGTRTVTVSGTGYSPASTTTTAGSFAITGVSTLTCTTLSATQRRVRFNPQYVGTNGSPISFAVVGLMLPTTTAGPYTLDLYNDNPAITLNTQQGNTQSSFTYRWLEACTSGASAPPTTYAASVTYTAPASCSSTPTPNPPVLALSVTPGSCASATNQYALAGTISLTNAVASSLTITDGSTTATLSVSAGQTSASFSLTGLASGTGSRSVTVSGAGYTSVSATYTAPASCSSTPTPNPPVLALSVTPGSCVSATNQYALAGTISLTNAVASSLTITDGTAKTTLSVSAGQTSASFSLTGLISGTGSRTVTVSGTGYTSVSATYTAPVSCSSTPTPNPPVLALSVTPGSCVSATNQYALAGTISLTNAVASSLTITDGTANTTLSVSAGQTSANFSLTGLISGTGSRTVTVSGTGYTSVSATYTAPVSCSSTPTPNPPVLALSVTPGSCVSATNQYALAGTISLTNAVASSLTITDGTANTTLSVTAGQTSASFSLTGLPSGSGTRTVTVSGTGYSPASTTTTAGSFAITGVSTLTCTTLSATQRRVRFNPQYVGTDGSPISFAVVGLMLPTTTAGPYTLDLYNDNPAITLNTQQGNTQSSFTYRWLEACTSGASAPPTTTYAASATYTAPASCSSTPTPNPPVLALSVTPGSCASATNQYALAGTISLTNAVASSLTITDGSTTATLSVSAGQTSASFSLTGLASSTGSRSVTVSGAGYTSVSATYTAPVSCSSTPTPNPPVLALSVTPGSCVSATNQYALAGTISLTNAVASSLTITDGTAKTTLSVTAGQTSASFSLTGLISGTGSRSVTVSGTGYTSVSATYTAPASCSSTPTPNPPVLALSVTPGSCVSATNQYALAGTISLTNAVASSLTITDGSTTATLSVSAGQTSASFSLTGLISGTGSRSVTVSGTGYTSVSATYTAPVSCSSTPTPTPPVLALSVTPGSCVSATNQYALAGTISLTNAVASSLTITDGTANTTLSVTAGQTSASFSLTGLPSGSGTRTVTVSGTGYSPASTTTTAGSFAITGVSTLTCTTLSATQRRVRFNPQYVGTNGSPISFAIVGLMLPTTTAGPYTLDLYNDNPAITLNTQQGNTQSSFTYRWLEACTSGASAPPTTTYAASVTYTAPASCSSTPTPNPPVLALSVTPGSCVSATNQYALAGTISLTNAVASSLTITDGTAKTTLSVSAGQTSASFSLTGLISGTGSRSVTVSGTGYTSVSATYTAPASCSSTPTPNPPVLALSVTPGSCASATNQYVLAGTISLTNAVASSLTITDGTAKTTLSVSAGQTSASFSLTGLISGTGSRSVTVSGTGYTSVSATYTAPASCSSTPTPTPPVLALSVTPGSCATATNQYALAGTISLTNAVASSLTITDGTAKTTLSVSAGQTSASFSLTGLISGTGSRSVTVSGAGYTSVSMTYTAPASCLTKPTPPPPTLALSVTPGNCNPNTNLYNLTGTITLTNAVSSSLLITDGVINKVIPVTAGQTTANFILTGLSSGSGSHTVIVSDMTHVPGSPISPAQIAIVGVTTVNCLTLSAGLRQVLFTPQYAGLSNGPVSFSVTNELLPTLNPGPYSLKLYIDNPMVTLHAQQGGSSGSFRYNWLQACATNPGSTTNSVGYVPVLAVYQAPASCKALASDVAPTSVGVAVALTVKPETCDPATNQYKLTGTINLTNTVAGSLLVTDGSVSTVLTVTDGQTSANFSLTGLASGTGARTVTVSESGQVPTTGNSAGPFTIAGVTTSNCTTVSATQRQVTLTPQYTGVNGSPISFSVSNETSPTTTPGPYVLNLFIDNPTVTLNAQQGQEKSTFLYKWLEACANSGPASLVYAPVSTTYTAPDACFATPRISLVVTQDTSVTKSPNGRVPAAPGIPLKLVDKSKAKVGDVLTYTLVITNSGTTDLVDAVVRDSASIGLTYVPNSAIAPAGTVFTPGNGLSTWTVARLAPNERLSLVFKARIDSTGILYNTATVQGDTAIVCTTVPVKVCPGSVYSFTLVAKQGRSTYRWFRDGREIRGEINHILVVTAPGSYSLNPSGGTGICPDFSCCPFVVEFDTLPSFKAMAVPVTCTDNTPQTNGKLVISEFDPSFTYQYSLGTQFNPLASLSGRAQTIPTNGILVNNLANPGTSQTYTVRVYNHSGCYRDVTTTLVPTACGCLADACVPFVIQRSKRAR